LFELDRPAHALIRRELWCVEFDICITHDAEDLIHPESFAITNAYADDYDMIQIPVLPLPTPFRKTGPRDCTATNLRNGSLRICRQRAIMGSFRSFEWPSGREFTPPGALQKLASAEHNLIFDPACLTEDYENGLRLHKLGCKQVFVPVSRQQGSIVATREIFSGKGRARRFVKRNALAHWNCVAELGAARLARRLFAEVYWFWARSQGTDRQSNQLDQ